MASARPARSSASSIDPQRRSSRAMSFKVAATLICSGPRSFSWSSTTAIIRPSLIIRRIRRLPVRQEHQACASEVGTGSAIFSWMARACRSRHSARESCPLAMSIAARSCNASANSVDSIPNVCSAIADHRFAGGSASFNRSIERENHESDSRAQPTSALSGLKFFSRDLERSGAVERLGQALAARLLEHAREVQRGPCKVRLGVERAGRIKRGRRGDICFEHDRLPQQGLCLGVTCLLRVKGSEVVAQ